ncbi:helix-turn-helix domain-containing protein [Jiulongibacter sediminis]|uniref:helix-turn-helix domain-containing protein n=1 Tax=Jiulongibacter sediminis TaxID=1605367 RepID=UPI0006DCCF83|nr:helix-turn-helix domain-containing protein [Jiulongibacter sediminis]
MRELNLITKTPSDLWCDFLHSFEVEKEKPSHFKLKDKFGTGWMSFERVGFDLKHLFAEFSFNEKTRFVFDPGNEEERYLTIIFCRSNGHGTIHFGIEDQLTFKDWEENKPENDEGEGVIHYVTTKLNEIPEFTIVEGEDCRLDFIFLNKKWLAEILPDKFFETFNIPFVFKSRLSHLIISGSHIDINELFEILKEFHESEIKGAKRLEKLGELYTFLSGFFETIHCLRFDPNSRGKVMPERDLETILGLEKHLRNNVEGETPDLVSLSEKFGMSKTKLCNTFKDFYGASIISYYNIIKLDHAKKVLISKPDSVSDIAHRLSFSNQSYFNRWFKKLSGVSPGEFRRGKRTERVSI